MLFIAYLLFLLFRYEFVDYANQETIATINLRAQFSPKDVAETDLLRSAHKRALEIVNQKDDPKPKGRAVSQSLLTFKKAAPDAVPEPGSKPDDHSASSSSAAQGEPVKTVTEESNENEKITQPEGDPAKTVTEEQKEKITQPEAAAGVDALVPLFVKTTDNDNDIPQSQDSLTAALEKQMDTEFGPNLSRLFGPDATATATADTWPLHCSWIVSLLLVLGLTCI